MARVTPSEVRRSAAVLLIDWAALGIAVAVTPGVSAHSSVDILVAAAVLGIAGAVLRPLFTALTVRLGWIGVFAGWLLAQAALVYLALLIAPHITIDGFWSVFWASWIYAVLASVGLWFVTAGDNAAVVGYLLRTTRKPRRTAVATTRPGVVM